MSKTRTKTLGGKGQAQEEHTEETAGEAASSVPELAKNLFLKPDSTAVSPFEEFPGEIIMPAVMNMPMHQEYSRFLAEAPQEWKQLSVFQVNKGAHYILASEFYYRVVFKYGRVLIKPADKTIELNEEGYQVIPALLAAFIACVGLEWQRRHTQFPGFRSNGLAVSEIK